MRPTTFSRLMLVFMLVIALCVALLMGIFYFTMRDAQIESRMDALKAQAYDIAYLAATTETSRLETALGLPTTSGREMMRHKLRSVYDEYSAYCMVVDRSGQITAYFLSILEENTDLRAAFDARHIVKTLNTVLSGREVVAQDQGANGPMFTVAVPWIRNDRVMGAVLIQTAAQNVRSAYEGLTAKVALAALLTALVAGLLILSYTRRLSKPLREIADNASSMAAGDFSHRVPETGSREIYDLAVAFNTMSGKLEETEQTRRDFIANLSHELRSPMTNIRGFLQGMLDGTIPTADYERYLGIVLSETNRMTKLVTSLLNLSRMENDDTALSLSTFNINELIRLVLIAKVNQIEEKGLDMQLQFEEDSSFVLADHDQIEQVLINLMDNAIKFTPHGGRIQVLTCAIDTATMGITVQDNGIGILEQDIPYIFDRFYTADKAHTVGQGTGLGLAICKTILEKHHQRIEVLPRESGSAIRFTLQRAKAPLAEVAK